MIKIILLALALAVIYVVLIGYASRGAPLSVKVIMFIAPLIAGFFIHLMLGSSDVLL